MSKSATELLDEQQKRLALLRDRKVRNEARLESEKAALAVAQEEAVRLFGTADLAALRELLNQHRAENDRKVMEFLMTLDEVENKLTDIERQIAL